MARRILGIDPGLTRCGIGVVDVSSDRRAKLVAVEVIRTEPGEELSGRIRRIADGIDRLIAEHSPDAMALEQVFAQQNLRTVMGVAQASGVALLAAARNGIPIGLHTPTEVKAALTGFGGADKKQLGTMVAKVLGLDEVPKPADASDAIALAICHAWRSGGPQAPAAGDLTPAQQKWHAAQREAAKRGGNPRLKA